MPGRGGGRLAAVRPTKRKSPESESQTMQPMPAGAEHDADIELLLDEAFGHDRHARTAYRLREGAQPITDLCFVALRDDGSLAGSVQCWPVALTSAATGDVDEITLLGPIAVARSSRGAGIGGKLICAALTAAAATGRNAVLLVGDADYYGRFGFSSDATGGWSMPGPVEQNRLLAKITPELRKRLPHEGALGPVSAVPATRPASAFPLSATVPAPAG